MKEVTVLLTSCGRQDLLERTIDSFLKFNTYPIKEFWIFEDSGIYQVNLKLKLKYTFIKWIEPVERTGQINALDTLWGMCKTNYAFMCEDDWLFIKPGFIEASMKIMEADPTIAQVWLRDRADVNQHPIVWGPEYGILKSSHGLWSGIGFNPSLKRLKDYQAIGSYGSHTVFNRSKPWKSEAAISQVYNKLGFKGSILTEAYMRHIGDLRHVN